jgi:hypothetical protein
MNQSNTSYQGTNPDENYNSNNYMSAGSRAIMEQKVKAEE